MTMPLRLTRFLAMLGGLCLLAGCAGPTLEGSAPRASQPAVTVSGVRTVEPGQPGSSLLGAPSDGGVLINTLASAGMKLVVNYGTSPEDLASQTPIQSSADGTPIVTEISGLNANTEYFYAVATALADDFLAAPTQSFQTQRDSGTQFSFGVQGDSHPERDGKMFDAEMYRKNAAAASAEDLDFYIMMGDDFSIDKLIQDGTVSQETVNERYLLQRSYLDPLGSTTPIFTANGNHEQAAKYLLDGTTSNPAVYAGVARNTFFPMAPPGGFYSVDPTEVEGVGYIRDYYAFEWGDALFVVIDPYWHSNSAVDNSVSDSTEVGAADGTAKSGGKNKSESTPKVKGKGKNQATSGSTDSAVKRNLWDNTLGNDQYVWLVDTLQTSKAKYKFVFTHHVLGTGRGGVEVASLYEWGGYDKSGDYAFPTERPEWISPIHQLMADNNVTIFFQGHDHLFAQQELDGVTYQTVPCPADPTFTAFNADAYASGTILPNSGFLKVTVATSGVTVDYIANGGASNGQKVYSYTIESAQ